MTSRTYFFQGIKDTIPTMLGYFPASLAFGLTGTSIGLSPMELFAISFFVYAGSAQFFILASLQLGMPILSVVFLVFMLNLRHLLYGPIIEPYLPEGLKKRLAKAFLLTDEVFAICYLKLKTIPAEGKTPWYFAVGLFAWWSWLLGTLVGIFAGEYIFKSYPLLAQTMGFALTALFVGVTFLVVQSSMLLALGIGGLVSLFFAYIGWSSVAMLAGAAVACLVYQPPQQTSTLIKEGDSHA
ncbi:AzlC family ABC transporter permease [Pelistega suis]|uniref:Branched-chain amino acid ABC transporter permease n=1 Tax=Pelistega suis TaxID=1631957 RepID=A0A849PB06_9BURK|nr:AzlC family ABC transporter permease [Pelistega suis]NOL52077.1 branched-chain amino acid ABC transporter permease [Pelistega suis]